MSSNNQINLEKTDDESIPDLSRNLPALSEETKLLAIVAAGLYSTVKDSTPPGFKREIVINHTIDLADKMILAARKKTRNI